MASVIRIKATGAWRAQVRRKGFEPHTATFPTHAEAKASANKIEHKIDRDERPGLTRAVTVADVLDVYEQCTLSSSQRARVNHLRKQLGKERVATLVTSDLARFCRYRIEEDEVKRESVRMDLNTLSAAFKFYAGEKDVIMTNVVKDSRVWLREQKLLSKSADAVGRDRRPEADELRDVLKHLDPEYHDVLRFAIASPMRRSEIAKLVWSDVVARDRCVWVRARKDPERPIDGLVPLLGAAWDILQRQPKREGEPRIFPFIPKQYTKAFRKACAAAGVPNLRGHDLRHEGISRLAEAGPTLAEIKVVSGHKPLTQLQKYIYLRPRDLHKHTAPSLQTVV